MQEPQSNEKIKEFCEEYYKVTFPMTKKIAVKGRNQHSIYQRLTNKELNNKKDSIILRNFQKYLVSETGELIEIFKPYVDPLDEKIRKHFNTN
jgi:glutathione peroxidase